MARYAVARERLLGQPEFPGYRLVHVEDVAGGQGDVVDAVQARMEVGGDVPADGGLAGAYLAGEQADAAQFDEVLQSRLGLAVGAGLEQFVGGDGGGSGAGSSVSMCEDGRTRRTAVLA